MKMVPVPNEATCKGCWQLGNNCRSCQRCIEAMPEAIGYLADEVRLLRDVVAYAISILDGDNDKYTLSPTVNNHPLIRKMSEHIDAYHQCYDLACKLEGEARNRGRADAATWLDDVLKESDEARDKLLAAYDRIVKQSDALSRVAEKTPQDGSR